MRSVKSENRTLKFRQPMAGCDRLSQPAVSHAKASVIISQTAVRTIRVTESWYQEFQCTCIVHPLCRRSFALGPHWPLVKTLTANLP